MADRRLRVLLSEGSSLTAREVVTLLGRRGHVVEVLDPNPFGIARFSRFVRRWHHSPPFAADPDAYLRFVADLLDRERFDVLLPTHEQALLFARFRDSLGRRAGLAVADYDAYLALQDKASFSRLIESLGLPQPQTIVATNAADLAGWSAFPAYLKTAYGASSAGVWRVADEGELGALADRLAGAGRLGPDRPVVVQRAVVGDFLMVATVFDRGRPLAIHTARRLVAGAQGSSSAKISAVVPDVLDHVARLGAHLRWHGALALDAIVDEATRQPMYIDANPRLVEPANAALGGADLVELLVELSLGESPEPVASRPGARTHMLGTALLGVAQRGGSRRALLGEIAKAAIGVRAYRDSVEELFPLRMDPPAGLALGYILALLFASPSGAMDALTRSAASLSLTGESLAAIAALPKDLIG